MANSADNTSPETDSNQDAGAPKKDAPKKAVPSAADEVTQPKAGDTNDAGQIYVPLSKDGEDGQLVLKPSTDYSQLRYGFGWTDTSEEQA